MKIAIASDHAGPGLKSNIVDFLLLSGHEVVDYGLSSESTLLVNYPEYADAVASEVAMHRCEKGILICGTGMGMCVTANKFPGVRAAVVYDEPTARLCKAHNDVNVLCLGARLIHPQRAVEFVKIWLSTPYEEGRHCERIQKIFEIEKRLYGR